MTAVFASLACSALITSWKRLLLNWFLIMATERVGKCFSLICEMSGGRGGARSGTLNRIFTLLGAVG